MGARDDLAIAQELSPETLELFATLLDGLTLKANAPDFLATAQRVAVARMEVAAALERSTHPETSPMPVRAMSDG